MCKMERTIFDTETFISLIEPNPCLWDPSHSEYFNKIKKQQCWVEIAEKMCDSFKEKSSLQQNEYGK